MKKLPFWQLKNVLFAGVLLTLFSCSVHDEAENIFYINNQSDFDRYMNAEFIADTYILFASGKIFNGQFAPTGSGTREKPIKVTAYDPESGEIFWDDSPALGAGMFINENGGMDFWGNQIYNGLPDIGAYEKK